MEPTVTALRRVTATGSRRGLLIGTAVLAVLVSAAVATSENHDFADISRAVQSIISIVVPYIAILLVSDLRNDKALPLAPTIAAAVLVGVTLGVLGAIASAVAAAASGGAMGSWATTAAGGILVQVIPALVGTGLGQLIRPIVVAFLATIVLPIGLWLLITPLGDGRAWLTPYEVARNLLSDEIPQITWLQWLVVAVLWGGGLNLLGASRTRRG